MKKKVSLIFDGKKIDVEEDLTILEVAKQLGVKIPTLCYHEAVAAQGACRICSVEVIRKGWPRLVTACNYPVRDGIEIKTNSEKVIRIRKLIIELLLARCPNVKILQDLAEELNVKRVRFKKKDENCILCGLCTRVCEEIMGVSAISPVNRGTAKKITTPFDAGSDVCIGCGACAAVCPTEAIKIEDIADKRTIHNWNTTVKLRKCKDCGKYFAPVPQLDSLKGKTAVLEDLLKLCPDCRRKTSETNIIKAKKL